MKATTDQMQILLDRYGIAPLSASGSDSADAAEGGRLGSLRLLRKPSGETLELTVDDVLTVGSPPKDLAEALAIVRPLRLTHALPDDASFIHMLGDLMVKATRLFEGCDAVKLEFSALRLHPTSYHIGKAVLLADKPLHLKARLEPHSHDRRAVFDHRHGDSTKNPK